MGIEKFNFSHFFDNLIHASIHKADTSLELKNNFAVPIQTHSANIKFVKKIGVYDNTDGLISSNEYKIPLTVSGPTFDSIDLKENAIVVHFKNSKRGLMIGRSLVGEVKEEKNGQLFGFELADREGIWHSAEAIIKNESVVVSSNGNKNPKAVRYACHPQAPQGRQGNLYTKDGLPASPF